MAEYKGLDISNWQAGMDVAEWVNRLGLKFIILKVGGNEGGRYADRCFSGFYNQCKKAGVHVGAYYYTTSTTVAAAKADAEHCLGLLRGYDLDMPVYMDVEDRRQFALSKRALTDVIKAFCDRVNAGGRRAGIYTGGSAWFSNVYKDELYQYADWIAWWSPFPGGITGVRTRCGDVGMWQVGSISLAGHIAYGDTAGHQDYDICCIEYWGRDKTEQKAATKTEKTEKKAEPSKLLSYSDLAAEVMWHKITDPAHGYSQPNRSTEYTDKETITLSDGTTAKIAAYDDDCSSAIRDCYRSIGVDVNVFTYTGNQAQGLLNSGNFKRITVKDAQNGDILLRTNHTEMLLVRNNTRYQGGFRHGDMGITGRRGDQDGTESTYSLFQPGAWTEAFRCIKKREGALPQGASTSTNTSVEANNTYGGKLTVDGWAGYNTVLDMQHVLKTFEDGVISGQTRSNDKYRDHVSAVEYGDGGSPMVRALQKLVGVEQDGYWGKDTSAALQGYLVKLGYKVEVDGYFGPESVKALQRALNDGKLK